jgi:hypothetical protein
VRGAGCSTGVRRLEVLDVLRCRWCSWARDYRPGSGQFFKVAAELWRHARAEHPKDFDRAEFPT